MERRRVLVSGGFGHADRRFGFFERIAEALEACGWQVGRFDALGDAEPPRPLEKAAERLFTLPGRWLGVPKDRVRAALPWTVDGRRERALVEAVRTFAPEVLIVISSVRFQPGTLARCRALGVREAVGWYVEGPIDLGVPEAESRLYDRYYCIHREIDAACRGRIGVLPSYALDAATFHPLRPPGTPRAPQPRIAFVGAPSRRRLRYLAALRALPLEIWGPGWSRQRDFAPLHRGEALWGKPLNALYNDSAIVLNVSSWEPRRSGMTQRIVEVPASGAFLLTDDAEEARRLYVAGDEIATFGSPEDLRAKCEHYLAHAGEREAIAGRGYRRALTFAGYDTTASVLIGCLDEGRRSIHEPPTSEPGANR